MSLISMYFTIADLSEGIVPLIGLCRLLVALCCLIKNIYNYI